MRAVHWDRTVLVPGWPSLEVIDRSTEITRMADHAARPAHRSALPLVDHLPAFVSKGDVLLCKDGIDHLHITFRNAGTVAKTAQETLRSLAFVHANVVTLLLLSVALIAVIAQESLREITAFDQFILRALVATLVAIVVVGSWCGRGGPAWVLARRKSTPDGPRGWPVLGSWGLMQGSTVHRELAQRAWEGGASTRELMALSVGATRIVLASDPTVAKHILQSPVFGDRPLKQAAAQLGFARAIGFAPQGPYWRHLRKLAVTHLFSHKQISHHHHHHLQRETSRMITAIHHSIGPLPLRPFLQRAAVNNITSAVLGRHFPFGGASPEAEALEGLIREGFALLGDFSCADHLPLLRLLPFLPHARRCRRLRSRVRAFLQPILDERRRGDAFVDVLLAQHLPDDDLISVLWEMVFRGTDTIAVLTEWALAEVILNPGIQRRIHKELDEVVGRSRLVQHKDMDQLPYLQAVVKETLRSHPPGPLLSWARLANEDTQVAGYHVPQGTTAMVNMWAITHDATVWPNPDTFDPSRFMKDEGGVDFDVLGTDLRLAPFGSGRRVCPGRSLGIATAQLWLACLLHHFSWSQDPEHPIELTDNLKLSCEMALPLHACAMVRVNSG